MTINDEYITMPNKSTSEKISKDDIKDVKIYDDMIIIYTSSITEHIITTRYLDKKLKITL